MIHWNFVIYHFEISLNLIVDVWSNIVGPLSSVALKECIVTAFAR